MEQVGLHIFVDDIDCVCLISYPGSVPKEEEHAEKSAKNSSSAKTSAEEAVHDVVKDDTE